jgi:ABC-type phosphate transport system permease subunit
VPWQILKEKPGCGYAVLIQKTYLASAASVLVARPTAAAGVSFLKEKPAGSTETSSIVYDLTRFAGFYYLLSFFF